MTELQILFRINEMRGKSITLNQSIEVMGRGSVFSRSTRIRSF